MFDWVLDKGIGLLSLQGKARMLYREYSEKERFNIKFGHRPKSNKLGTYECYPYHCLLIFRLIVASCSPDTLLLHPLLFHVLALLLSHVTLRQLRALMTIRASFKAC